MALTKGLIKRETCLVLKSGPVLSDPFFLSRAHSDAYFSINRLIKGRDAGYPRRLNFELASKFIL